MQAHLQSKREPEGIRTAGLVEGQNVPLWTVQEVALYLRLEPQTVRVMARVGKLPAIKVGRAWRFDKAALDAFLTGQSVG